MKVAKTRKNWEKPMVNTLSVKGLTAAGTDLSNQEIINVNAGISKRPS